MTNPNDHIAKKIAQQPPATRWTLHAEHCRCAECVDRENRVQHAMPAGAQRTVAMTEEQREVVRAFLEAQDALDNREFQGINGEDWGTLRRRRNVARDELDNALAAPAAAQRCKTCDDTGDVHAIDGEWRGRCSCPAGAYAATPAPEAAPTVTVPEPPKTPQVDALMAEWEADGATRGAAFIRLRDLARELELLADAEGARAAYNLRRARTAEQEVKRLGDLLNEDRSLIANALHGRANAPHNAGDIQRLIERAGLNSTSAQDAGQRLPLAVLQALRFYANGEHFSDADEKLDDVSGEPSNWLCHEDDATMLENGLVARMALQGQPLAWEAGCEPEPLDGEVFVGIKEAK